MIPASPDGQLLFGRSKLADLGLARVEDSEEELTSSRIGMGTPGYVSPEQGRDARSAKKSADVFGMGATLYALLCNTAPYRGPDQIDTLLKTIEGRYVPIAELRPDVSKPTVAIIERCLPPKPEDRFQDANALLEALELAYASLGHRDGGEQTIRRVSAIAKRAEQGQQVAVRPRPRRRAHVSGPPVPADRHARRGQWIGLAAVGLFVVIAALFFFGRDSEPPAPAGELLAGSTPSGATVRIDGVVRGTTPLTLTGLSGDHEVRIEKEGYVPFVRPRVSLTDRRVDLNAVLVRVTIETVLRIQSTPDGAEITIDGRVRGLTPLNVTDLDEGRHAVTLSLAGYESLKKVIAFRSGKSETLSRPTSWRTAWLRDACGSSIWTVLRESRPRLTVPSQGSRTAFASVLSSR